MCIRDSGRIERYLFLIFSILGFAYFIFTLGSYFSSVSLSREVVIVGASIALIIILAIVTIVLTPSRMTVIAGIAIGLVVAVLMVETFLWVNGIMNHRLDQSGSTAHITYGGYLIG